MMLFLFAVLHFIRYASLVNKYAKKSSKHTPPSPPMGLTISTPMSVRKLSAGATVSTA